MKFIIYLIKSLKKGIILIKKAILLFFVIYELALNPEEFVYPVAADNNFIYVLHQKSLYSMELLSLNMEHNYIQKCLLSIYLPGNIKLMPNHAGFSFIDQGKLRIKNFNSRSPKTINFNELIYDLTNIEWIDEKNFYFSAKKKNFFCIFHYNLADKKCYCIKEDLQSDYFYPQKILSDLFCIRRNQNNFQIIKLRYPKDLKIKNNDFIEILTLENMHIAFLIMINSNQGFFLEHANLVDRENKCLFFTYWNFFKTEQKHWHKEKLFDFSLPIKYLFGSNNERLYESILPFLPKLLNNKIYFCNANESDLSVNIFSFDLTDKKIERKTSAQNCNFSPVLFKDKIFYGFNDKKFDKNGQFLSFFDSFESDTSKLPSFKI